jgi:hypothetical protein
VLTDSLIIVIAALRFPPVVRGAASTAADDASWLRSLRRQGRSCWAALSGNAVDAKKQMLVLRTKGMFIYVARGGGVDGKGVLVGGCLVDAACKLMHRRICLLAAGYKLWTSG